MPTTVSLKYMNYHDYKILKKLENNPKVNQRQLAKEMDVSLGKINYCLKALIDKGWIKVQRFRQSTNKRAYLYQLTPDGITAKAQLTKSFLKQKLSEYDQLKKEIEHLKVEVEREDRKDSVFSDKK